MNEIIIIYQTKAKFIDLFDVFHIKINRSTEDFLTFHNIMIPTL
jgi:hypothetical protein